MHYFCSFQEGSFFLSFYYGKLNGDGSSLRVTAAIQCFVLILVAAVTLKGRLAL